MGRLFQYIRLNMQNCLMADMAFQCKKLHFIGIYVIVLLSYSAYLWFILCKITDFYRNRQAFCPKNCDYFAIMRNFATNVSKKLQKSPHPKGEPWVGR